jgi:peptide/nickel transport system substrate-binding protein
VTPIHRLAGRALVLAFAAALLTQPGCGGRRAEEAAYTDTVPPPAEPLTRQVATVGRYGGRFILAEPNTPRMFNAMMATDTASTDITDRLFGFLVDYDHGTQQYGPGLAKSWDVSADGVTWTFHLRKGAAFSDGRPITAADVLFSFEVAYDDTLHPIIQEMLEIDGQRFTLSAPDPYTVVINTGRPHAGLLDALCPGNLAIMPKHVLEEPFRKGTFAAAYNVSTPPEQLVTSGAWRLRQHVPNERTVLVRNPHYYAFDQNKQRLPYLDEVVYLVVPDQDAADLRFRSGGADGVDDVKPENYRWYEENQAKGNFTLYDLGAAQNTHMFWFNLNRVQPPARGDQLPPGKKVGEPFVDPVKYGWFSNGNFRRAVSMAIDRDAMVSSVFSGYGEKSWSQSTSSNKEWYSADLVTHDYNPEAARKLLAGMGFRDANGDGALEDAQGRAVSFILKTNSSNALRISMGNFMRDDLAKIGIRMTLAPADFNTVVTNIHNDFQYEAILLGFQSSVPPTPFGGQNVWRSSGESHQWFVRQQKPATPQEARIDQLLDVMLTTQDRQLQKSSWKEIQNTLNDQAWFIWLPIQRIKVPVSNRFGNVQPSVMAHRILWNIDRVFVKPRPS